MVTYIGGYKDELQNIRFPDGSNFLLLQTGFIGSNLVEAILKWDMR